MTREINNLDKSLDKVYTKDKRMRVIGIAGGIGSGKSSVTNYLKYKLYTVYDADEEAREAVKPGEPALLELVNCFGKEILNDDGTLNRRKLAQLAFSSQEKTDILNEILHKDIDERIDKKLARHASYLARSRGKKIELRIAFVSAPLFFEANLQKKCDETWVVVADEDIRVKRTMERDNLPESEVRDRIARQMSDEERIKLADHVITNNGTKEELTGQVSILLKEAMRKASPLNHK